MTKPTHIASHNNSVRGALVDYFRSYPEQIRFSRHFPARRSGQMPFRSLATTTVIHAKEKGRRGAGP